MKLTGGSFSSFEFGFGDWTIYKWMKIYYGSSEATEFSIDNPPLEESLGKENEVIEIFIYLQGNISIFYLFTNTLQCRLVSYLQDTPLISCTPLSLKNS